MAMQTDVKSEHMNASGILVSGRYRIKGYQIKPSGTAGTIIFTDGGASGVNKLELDITTNTAIISTLIPGEGILFETDVYVTLPASTSITVFYG